MVTWSLSASDLSSKVTITLSRKQLFLACLWPWKISMSDQLFAPPIEGFNCLFFLPFLNKENVFIWTFSLQLFRERLSEKVRTTVLRGIVGGVKFTVLCSSEKFERFVREATEVCLRMLNESNNRKFDSYSVRNRVFTISHIITFQDCRVHSFSDNLSRESCKYNVFYMQDAMHKKCFSAILR